MVQLAECYGSLAETNLAEMPPVQKQGGGVDCGLFGGVDCGLFVVEFATDLAASNDPTFGKVRPEMH